jgi:hypothetical protein
MQRFDRAIAARWGGLDGYFNDSIAAHRAAASSQIIADRDEIQEIIANRHESTANLTERHVVRAYRIRPQ